MAFFPPRSSLVGVLAVLGLGAALALGPSIPAKTVGPSATNAATLAVAEADAPPLVWPLGVDGYVPRELYSTHGQYQCFETSSSSTCTANTHKGIDMGACYEEPVYAVAAGTVKHVQGEGGQYATVFVSDGDSGTLTYKYQHLRDIKVGPPWEVERDQLLGYVEKWIAFCGYDHLHFQVLTYTWVNDALIEDDVGNPLPLLPARPDAAVPVIAAVDDAGQPTAPFVFYDGDWNELPTDPAMPLNGKIHVVARAWEVFPGSGPAFCPSSECCDAGFSKHLAPYRLTLSVLEPDDPTDDPSLPRTIYEPVYQNTIELSGPNPASESVELAKKLYQENSKGDYDDRDLRFVLTYDKDLVLDALASDVYRFELLIEDTSGNVAVQRMAVKVAQ